MRLHTDLVKDSKFWKTSQDRDRIYTRHTSIETSGHGDNIVERKRKHRWQRGQELGRGAFGIVWKEKLVDGESDAKERAVKMIRKQFGKSKIDYARELEAIAKFSRGRYKLYFVESFGWYESLDDVFIAMEYFEHGDLENYLLEVRNMPENDVRIISNQVLKGVEQMHVNRFAHRDLKPGNILIRRLGDHKLGWLVKIGDFGISKRAEEGMTALRTFGGSSGYIAPEILVKDNRLFPTAHVHDKLEVEKEGFALVIDIWAVGSIIYRALCGVTPFETGLLAYVNGKEFSAHELNEFSVSTEGIGLIRKLLEVYPDDRLTAAEALEDPWFNELQVNSPRSSGEYEYVDENCHIPPARFLAMRETDTSGGSSSLDATESAPWTELDETSSLRPNETIKETTSPAGPTPKDLPILPFPDVESQETDKVTDQPPTIQTDVTSTRRSKDISGDVLPIKATAHTPTVRTGDAPVGRVIDASNGSGSDVSPLVSSNLPRGGSSQNESTGIPSTLHRTPTLPTENTASAVPDTKLPQFSRNDWEEWLKAPGTEASRASIRNETTEDETASSGVQQYNPSKRGLANPNPNPQASAFEPLISSNEERDTETLKTKGTPLNHHLPAKPPKPKGKKADPTHVNTLRDRDVRTLSDVAGKTHDRDGGTLSAEAGEFHPHDRGRTRDRSSVGSHTHALSPSYTRTLRRISPPGTGERQTSRSRESILSPDTPSLNTRDPRYYSTPRVASSIPYTATSFGPQHQGYTSGSRQGPTTKGQVFPLGQQRRSSVERRSSFDEIPRHDGNVRRHNTVERRPLPFNPQEADHSSSARTPRVNAPYPRAASSKLDPTHDDPFPGNNANHGHQCQHNIPGQSGIGTYPQNDLNRFDDGKHHRHRSSSVERPPDMNNDSYSSPYREDELNPVPRSGLTRRSNYPPRSISSPGVQPSNSTSHKIRSRPTQATCVIVNPPLLLPPSPSPTQNEREQARAVADELREAKRRSGDFHSSASRPGFNGNNAYPQAQGQSNQPAARFPPDTQSGPSVASTSCQHPQGSQFIPPVTTSPHHTHYVSPTSGGSQRFSFATTEESIGNHMQAGAAKQTNDDSQPQDQPFGGYRTFHFSTGPQGGLNFTNPEDIFSAFLHNGYKHANSSGDERTKAESPAAHDHRRRDSIDRTSYSRGRRDDKHRHSGKVPTADPYAAPSSNTRNRREPPPQPRRGFNPASFGGDEAQAPSGSYSSQRHSSLIPQSAASQILGPDNAYSTSYRPRHRERSPPRTGRLDKPEDYLATSTTDSTKPKGYSTPQHVKPKPSRTSQYWPSLIGSKKVELEMQRGKRAPGNRSSGAGQYYDSYSETSYDDSEPEDRPPPRQRKVSSRAELKKSGQS